MSGSDVDLLRQYEPIVRYTRGEFFFPMRVEPYVAECDLWGVGADGERTQLVRRGELTLDALASWTSRVPDRSLFLRFVQQPLNAAAVAQRRGHTGRPPFSAPSRLARVGIIARLIDAGFDLSLLVRGTVPGGTVAAGEVKYAAIRAADPGFYYHGRVVRQAGWTVCHYLFFYAMNDWRSSFAGANDHEADWEQCFVFLEERDDGSTVPVWFARAAHDEVGADLRRRWDDPLLLRDGDHPIVFAGAGSHAAYIEPGEYLQSVPLRLPPRLRSFAEAARRFWTTTLALGQGDADATSRLAAVPTPRIGLPASARRRGPGGRAMADLGSPGSTPSRSQVSTRRRRRAAPMPSSAPRCPSSPSSSTRMAGPSRLSRAEPSDWAFASLRLSDPVARTPMSPPSPSSATGSCRSCGTCERGSTPSRRRSAIAKRSCPGFAPAITVTPAGTSTSSSIRRTQRRSGSVASLMCGRRSVSPWRSCCSAGC